MCSEHLGCSQRAGGAAVLPSWCPAGTHTAGAGQPQSLGETATPAGSQHWLLELTAVPSPCCGTLSLLKTQPGRAWKEHFLWKEGYCALLSRLLIESFKLKWKFYIFLPELKVSIQSSPHFVFLPTVSASCSSCLFTAGLSWVCISISSSPGVW